MNTGRCDMVLGYTVVDHDGVYYNYCNDCYDKCDPWFQYLVSDTIEKPFKCDGCGEDICHQKK